MPRTVFDKTGERWVRHIANFSSRRGFLSRLGLALVAPTLPLLPVARAASAAETKAAEKKTDFERYSQSKDDTKCNYWKYCASDGVLCSCCGGVSHTCPPGTEPSPISWIGTCLNPDDGRSYVIAYRDCCGKAVCRAESTCRCDGDDRELPTYRAQLNNDIIWCFGSSTQVYHCSTSALVSVAN